MKKLYLVSVLVLPVASGFGMDDRPGGTKSFSSETMIALKFINDAKQDGTTTTSDETRMVPEKYVVCSEQLRGDLEFSDQKPDFLLLDRKVKDFDTLATYFPQIHAITTAPDANKREQEQTLASLLQPISQKKLGILFELADYLKIEPMVACGEAEIKNRLRSPQLLLQYYKGCPQPDEGYGLPEPIRREFFFDILKDLVPLISVHTKKTCLIFPDSIFSGTIGAMVYSHDGKFILMGNSHGRIAVVQRDGPEPELLTLPIAAHVGDITSMALSADDERLITAGHDLSVNIWETSSLKKIKESGLLPVQSINVSGTKKRPVVIALSKEGILVLGRHDGQTKLYHEQEKEFKEFQSLPEPVILPNCPTAGITALVFSDDGATLFSGYSNGTIGSFQSSVEGVWHRATFFVSQTIFDPISALVSSREYEVVCARGNNTVGLASVHPQNMKIKLLKAINGPIKSLTCSPDGNTLVAVSKDIDLFSRDKGGNFRWSQIFGKHANITASALSPDGTILATGNKKGILEIFEFYSKPLETTLQEKASLHDLLLLTYVMRHQNSVCPHNNDELKRLYKQFHPDVTEAVKDVLNKNECLVCKN